MRERLASVAADETLGDADRPLDHGLEAEAEMATIAATTTS